MKRIYEHNITKSWSFSTPKCDGMFFSKLKCRELKKKVENHWVKEIVCYPSGDFLSSCLLIHILRSDIHLSDSDDDQHYQNLENKIDFIYRG